MKTLTIRAGEHIDDFFRRGRERARLMDQQLPLPEEFVISFGDPSDLLNLLSDERLELFRAVKHQTGSVASLAERLGRGRSAIDHDVDALQQAGLLAIDTITGVVRVTAPKIKLEAEFG